MDRLKQIPGVVGAVVLSLAVSGCGGCKSDDQKCLDAISAAGAVYKEEGVGNARGWCRNVVDECLKTEDCAQAAKLGCVSKKFARKMDKIGEACGEIEEELF